MLELVVLFAVVAGATIAIGERRRHTPAPPIDQEIVDLPCPWCLAQTREDDTACPSCHEPFGIRAGS